MQQQPPQGPFPPQGDFPQQNQPYGPPQTGMPKSSGLATAALICGLVGIIPCFFLIPSIIGLILGIIALVKINRSSGTLTGKGKAQAGIIIGLLCIIIFPVIIYTAFDSNISSGTADIDNYLKTISAGNYEKAYNEMLAPQFRAQISFEDFVKQCELDKKRNGEYMDCSFSLFQGNTAYINWNVGATTMQISVTARYSQSGNGKLSVGQAVLKHFTLIKSGEHWLIFPQTPGVGLVGHASK